jgi:uncharacterized membrane protein YfcA
MLLVLLFILGLIAGTLGSLVGIGGGIVIVPSLIYLYKEISPQVAAGTSLVIILLTSIASLLVFHRQRRIDYRSGLTFFIGAGPGAFVGAIGSRYFSVEGFLIGFGIFLLAISALMIFQSKLKPIAVTYGVTRTYVDVEGKQWKYQFHSPTAIVLSFFIGIMSSLFGVGGGLLFVPLMVILFQFPPLVATATSTFAIFLSAITGSFTHMLQGNVDWIVLLLIAPGSWLGGRLGAYLSQKMSNSVLLILFRIVLILAAVKMIFDGAHSL